jgi:cytochrome c biogenesis protein CcdA/thiol-disulfide isomerase/thioredoxin
MSSLLLYTLVYLAGVLTILSPCVLPVVPLVFGRADRPFRGDGAYMLAGIACTFAVAATAATATAGWVVGVSQVSRWGAMLLLGVVGASLLLPRLANGAARPLVRLGTWIERRAARLEGRRGAFSVGAAVGLLWAPCAGPVLGLVVAAAALGGPGPGPALLFLTFAAGAVTSLGVSLAAGGRLLAALRRALGADALVRRGLGALTLSGVLVLALGWDRALYARTPGAGAALEQRLARALAPAREPGAPRIGQSLDEFAAGEAAREEAAGASAALAPLADEGEMPELAGATAWLNGPPLTRTALRGRVVLVDFWTYGCYNCLNALPRVKALEAKYRAHGLVVVGVHTPEFPHEKVLGNVRKQVGRLGVVYPVAVDNDHRIWNAFRNRYWPAAYFVDRRGRVRFHHFGEGRYAEQDRVVQRLLAEPPPAAQ